MQHKPTSRTFPVPFPIEKDKENAIISNDNSNEFSKEQIINKAYKFHSEGNISEAIKYYQYFMKKGFNDPKVFSNYSNILKKLGKLEEAEKLTRKAIKLKPDLAEAYYNLGSILISRNKLEEAEMITHKAVKFKSNYIEAYINLANIYIDLRKLKKAEIILKKVINIQPNYSDAYYNLGSILIELGNFKAAEIYTRKAIEINHNYPQAYYNLGCILIHLCKLKEAEIYTRKAIELNPHFSEAHCNLGNILKDHGKLKEAEKSTRRAIELQPNFAEAFYNLASILRDLGKLKETEISALKAINIKPDLAKPYFILSTINSFDNKIWQEKLFSKDILKNMPPKDRVDIYFARSNVLHKGKKYKQSSKYLELANKTKLNIKSSQAEILIKKSKILFTESTNNDFCCKDRINSQESIFIVGMPRSGSTLLESIISMNNEVNALGEVNILEESFIEWKNKNVFNKEINLSEIYLKKIMQLNKIAAINTNKWLYNYQYVGIICKYIPNAKIIHCFRNPLDNILSIFRANFDIKGNSYTSSLEDCSRVYEDQQEIMNKYKNNYRSKIYDLNYDLLVTNPNDQIRALISWLGWEWSNSYLTPHLNNRSVSTASSSQVRSPIHSSSVGSWKNYRKMLTPAIEIIEKSLINHNKT